MDAPHLALTHQQSPALGTPGTGLSAVNRRIVVWENGVPVVRTETCFTKAQVSDIAMAAASQPYVTADDELAIELGLPPSRFYGMTNLEVMLLKQAENAARTGDGQEVDRILDRLIGKPLAKSENLNISDTYEKALERIGKAAAAKPIDAQVVSPLEL